MSGAAGAQPQRILDTGISVVYDPQDLPPVVDVVIVHGLHGHPYKSWTAKAAPARHRSPTSSLVASTDTHDESTGSWRRAIRRLGSNREKGTASRSKADSWNTTSTRLDEYSAAHEPVFWPADLLPAKCPRARVLTFGYDSKITKYMSGATNKGSLASHSKDLLFSTCRSRVSDRPIIFVAHSLGGIVVKEMLERSATASEPELKNIVESTAAVVFLGTPHRGSPDLAAMGEYLRSIVSGLQMQTTNAILDSLGLKTTDLERAQEAFSRTWQKYDFRVKTFQEGLGMSGLKLGVLANKVVPDYSSSIGDHREHCETLQANHKEMCRYTGDNDANWRKVSGELCSIYLSILEIHAAGTQLSRHVHLDLRSSQHSSQKAPEPGKKRILSDGEKSSLKSLWYPSMYTRMRRIEKPAEKTCSWLFEHQSYRDWFSGRNRDETHGLLWLKGNPGTGKSTLMKEAYNRTVQGQADGDHFTASFFFSAKDSGLEHSTINVWRSLLYQLLPNWPDSLNDFPQRLATRFDYVQEGEPEWEEAELMTVFQQAIFREKSKKIFIFIDALDECDTARLRNHAYFWRETTSLAHGYDTSLNVCISSRHFPLISLSNCPEIIVERHNNADIEKYVGQRFSLGVGVVNAQWKGLQNRICTRSLGVFLWAVLVVDDLLRNWDDGMDIQYLHKRLDVVPEALESLFYQMLSSVSLKDRMLTARLFQWAILSTKPLRVNEWHHILAFIRHPTPKSLSEWRSSDCFTQTDSQLERQIRSISKGLVEIRSTPEVETPDQALELLSIRAGAGSLNLELGETRNVTVVHKSVRDFFLHGAGFETLVPSLGLQPIGEGHLLIMQTCLDYLAIKELDALVEARRSLQKQSSIVAPGRASTFSTFPWSNPSSDAISQEKTDTVPEPDVSGPLRLSPDLLGNLCTGQGIDVARWVSANDDAFSVKSLTSLNGLAIQVASRSPSSCRSRLLEDYPALLSYATYEFFTHARLAQDDEVRADPIIGRLKFRAGWDRLAALREDIPHGIDLITYAMGAHSLTSWRFAWYQGPDLDYSCLKKFDVRQDRHSGDSSELRRKSAIVNEETEREEQSPPYNMSGIAKILDAAIARGSNQKPGLNKLTQKHMSGQGSVASFSSASSHTGSIDWTYTGEDHKTTGGDIDQRSVIDAYRSAEPRLGGQAPVLATPTILTRFTGRASICNSDDSGDESAIDDDSDDSDWEDPLEDSNGNGSERDNASLNQLAVSHLQPSQ